MMRNILFLGFVLLFLALQGNAQQLRIGLFRKEPVQSVMVTPGAGSYKVFGDSLALGKLEPGISLKISYDTAGVTVVSIGGLQGKFRQLLFVPQDSTADIKFKPLQPAYKEKLLRGKISIDSEFGGLRMLNHIDLEDYISGVVEAEAGYGHAMEFYKVQAIISRTYALSNIHKHAYEGFHLCDQVHCQAYKGKGKSYPAIHEAAILTHGIVIVDDSAAMITAAFHSNCGGQTANSEDVWSKPLPYLRSVKDNYCSTQPNAFWTRELPSEEWTNYLKKYQFPVEDSSCFSYCVSFKQPYRMYCLSSCNKVLPFKNIRTDLKLKSSFFSAELIAGKVILKGRGFGHGVGLCQEGAMKMAKLGFNYSTILHHYFTSVHIVEMHTLEAFSDN
jgi:stage II sporulation protein D